MVHSIEGDSSNNMILTCPKCSMRYSTSTSAIGEHGRKVRCASCSHNWMVNAKGEAVDEAVVSQSTKPAPAPEPVEAPKPKIEAPAPVAEPEAAPKKPEIAKAMRAKREADRKKQQRKRSLGIWSGIAASLVLVMAGAWVFKVDVVRVWPNTASAYAALGAKVNVIGLEIREIEAVRQVKNGGAVLHISGQIVNVSKRAQNVPLLQAKLVNDKQEVVFSWLVEPETDRLDVSHAQAFITEVRDPPPENLSLHFEFADELPAKPKRPIPAKDKTPAPAQQHAASH